MQRTAAIVGVMLPSKKSAAALPALVGFKGGISLSIEVMRLTSMKRLWKSLGVVVVGAFLASSVQAALVISDISGSTPAGNLYVYTDGSAVDTLGIPGRGIGGNGIFWEIAALSSNQLNFRTLADVGQSTAVLNLTGLEANDDWLTASITGSRGVPILTYAGGDTARLDFVGAGSWYTGDTITVTFEAAAISVPAPAPATIALLGLGLVGIGAARRKQA